MIARPGHFERVYQNIAATPKIFEIAERNFTIGLNCAVYLVIPLYFYNFWKHKDKNLFFTTAEDLYGKSREKIYF